MNGSEFVSDLQKVKSDGDRSWTARCPAHDDKRPSLSVKETEEGKILVHCHAGCSTEEIVDAMGLTMRDLFDDGSAGSAQIAATYDYHGADGTLLYQVVRFEPKDFRVRRPTLKDDDPGKAKDGWVWSLKYASGKAVPRVLYQLPEIQDSAGDAVVLVVEGEKDADRLRRYDYLATCNLGGAGPGKWRDDYSRSLSGRDVVVIPDNDETGKAHAVAAVRSLLPQAKSVGVLVLPTELNGQPVKDVSDYFDAGGTEEDFEKRWDEAVPGDAWLANKGLGPADETLPEFDCTEMGNAKRLLHWHGKDFRYCPAKGFLLWDGKRWQPDDDGRIRMLAMDTVLRIADEASGHSEGSDKRKEVEAWAKRSQTRKVIDNMIYLAQTEALVDPADFDRDPLLLNVSNGTLDLKTGVLKPHQREDLLTRLAPVDYKPEEMSDVWEALVGWAMSWNPVMVDFFQRALGYGLTGLTKEQAIFICWGTGANAKSTLLDTVVTVLGDYATVMDPETLMAKRGDGGIPNDVARLDGLRFVLTSECELGKKLAESRIKQITGGESMAARFLHKEFFTFKPVCKVFMGTNHKPVVHGADKGIWRRLLMVPFLNTVSDEERNDQLKDELLREQEGVLVWLVQGCQKYLHDGLPRPPAVLDATTAYRDEMDTLGAFINDCCQIGPALQVTAEELHDAYKEWAEENGEAPLSKRVLGLRLAEKGYESHRGHAGVRLWKRLKVGSTVHVSTELVTMTSNSTASPAFDAVADSTGQVPGWRKVTEGDATLELASPWFPASAKAEEDG